MSTQGALTLEKIHARVDEAAGGATAERQEPQDWSEPWTGPFTPLSLGLAPSDSDFAEPAGRPLLPSLLSAGLRVESCLLGLVRLL